MNSFSCDQGCCVLCCRLLRGECLRLLILTIRYDTPSAARPYSCCHLCTLLVRAIVSLGAYVRACCRAVRTYPPAFYSSFLSVEISTPICTAFPLAAVVRALLGYTCLAGWRGRDDDSKKRWQQRRRPYPAAFDKRSSRAPGRQGQKAVAVLLYCCIYVRMYSVLRMYFVLRVVRTRYWFVFMRRAPRLIAAAGVN